MLDPRGEVIIVVHNPNAPFAVWPPIDGSSTSPSAKSVEGNKSVTETADQEEDTGETTEAEPDVRIQVSAKHLILGSKVFDRMLGGYWVEARQLKEKGSVELDVEGWDVEALLVVLNIFHAFLAKVPLTLSLEKLAKIAVIADYYDCKGVHFFGESWLRPHLERLPLHYRDSRRDMILSLWVSWFFPNEAAFRSLSSAIMEQSDGPISSLGLPIPGKVLGGLISLPKLLTEVSYLLDQMNTRRVAVLDKYTKLTYIIRDSLVQRGQSPFFPSFKPSLSLTLGILIMHMKSFGLGFVQPERPYVGLQVSKVNRIGEIRSLDWWQPHCRFHLTTYCFYLGEDPPCLPIPAPSSIPGLELAEYTT